jgi:SAM-dependent methyltransferase
MEAHEAAREAETTGGQSSKLTLYAKRVMSDYQPGAGSFGAEYYATSCGTPYCRNEAWLTFFRSIADRIVADIGPRRVLDAGCALGLLVETLRERGVDTFGIDLSSFAIANAADSVRPFLKEGSIAADLEERYDLIVSIEVLEHMPPDEAEAAIGNFCRHTDDVLFSSSPLDYRETTHVNVRPPEYWAGQFGRHGFVRDVDFDASFITPWAVRFRRSSEPLHRIVAGYERWHAPLVRERADLRAHLAEVQDELQRTREDLARVQSSLAEARDTVAHMEQSAFWRLRQLSVSARALIGRGPGAHRRHD